MNNKHLEELEDAQAFWGDAVRQYWQATCDPKITRESLEGFKAYYLRASENLKRAFLTMQKKGV